MASIGSFDDDRDYGASGAPFMSQFGQVVNWAGAIVSLGLVVGMAIWAYQLAVRDVSGVPVIRALEGPMRSAPEDPGGLQADHQGLAVNRLAEGAAAAAVPDVLVLAPPPVDLTPLAIAATSPAAADPLPTPEVAASQTQALITQLLADAETAQDPLAGDDIAAEAAPEPRQVAAISPSIPGVARSIRPALRPATMLATSASSSSAAGLQAVTVRDIDVAELAAGTRLVQLGAFDSPAIAHAEWDRLMARFPDYFQGRARVIEMASSGGAPFYRLRAHGFEDLAASRRFCAALVARNAPCIPVTVR